LIDLPLTKCSRRIRPIVSTTSIPRHPLEDICELNHALLRPDGAAPRRARQNP
jgi:hypothetical protein